MRNLFSVTLLVIVLSVFAAARPLKQARVDRLGSGLGHKPRANTPSGL
jgi:hypothetical protein